MIQILKYFEITELTTIHFHHLPEHILCVFIGVLREEKCYFIVNVFMPVLLQTLTEVKSRIFLDLAQRVVLNTDEVLDFDMHIPETYFFLRTLIGMTLPPDSDQDDDSN